MLTRRITRRSALRGVLGGAAVSVGIPLLDCFLDTNGVALADTGAPIPTRFATWFWGCGLNPGRWEPKAIGKFDAFGPELQPLEAFRSKINVYSGLKVYLDGRINTVHFTGEVALLTGTVPHGSTVEAPSVDTIIADAVGTRTRFRSLEVNCTGDPLHSQSRRSASAINPGEVSPVALYTRIFGPDFADPNAATVGAERLVEQAMSLRPRHLDDGALPDRDAGMIGPAFFLVDLADQGRQIEQADHAVPRLA